MSNLVGFFCMYCITEIVERVPTIYVSHCKQIVETVWQLSKFVECILRILSFKLACII